MGHGIILSSEQGDPSIVVCVDSNYDRDMNDRKFTTRNVFT